MSITWFPSNGSEGAYMYDNICQKCRHEPDCEIILRSLTDGEPIEEWTAKAVDGLVVWDKT